MTLFLYMHKPKYFSNPPKKTRVHAYIPGAFDIEGLARIFHQLGECWRSDRALWLG